MTVKNYPKFFKLYAAYAITHTVYSLLWFLYVFIILHISCGHLASTDLYTCVTSEFRHTDENKQLSLQHGIQFLLPSKIVPPYAASNATSSLTS